MKIRDAAQLLPAVLREGLQPLLIGAPGVGKTDLAKAVSAALGWKLITSHPAVSSPTDFAGLPIPTAERDRVNFLPIGQMDQLIKAQEPTLWFIDDLGQAPAAVQAALMQLCHRTGRSLGDHRLSDHVRIMAATNGTEDGAHVRGMLDPLRSRFQLLLPIETDLESWSEWAFQNDIHPHVLAFLHWSEGMGEPRLHRPSGDVADLTQVTCPRSWEGASRLLSMFEVMNSPHRLEILQGAVGVEVGRELHAFLAAVAKMVSIRDILDAPDTAPVPSGREALSILYLTVLGCVRFALKTPKYLEPLLRYIDRTPGELRALARFQLEVSKNEDILQSAAFVRFTARLDQH